MASKYCDVVSYVSYSENTENLTLPKGAVDKPILAAESNFCALDRGVFGGGINPRKSITEQTIKSLRKFCSLRSPKVKRQYNYRTNVLFTATKISPCPM